MALPSDIAEGDQRGDEDDHRQGDEPVIPYGLDHLRDLHITTSKTDARGEIPRIHQLREDGQARVRRERLRSGGWPSLHPEHLTAQLAICAERRRGPLVGDPAAVEDVDAVGQGQHEVEIVLHDEDRHLPAQPVDGDEDRLADRRGQPFKRLVQQQEPEGPRQGARDGDHLLLAAREGLGAAGQALAGPGAELEESLGPPPAPVAATPPEPAELEVLRDREIREESPPLGHEADPEPRDLLGRAPAGGATGGPDAAPPPMSRPANSMRPRAGGARPITLLRVEDFPAPLRPRRPTTSPARSSSETSWRMWLLPEE